MTLRSATTSNGSSPTTPPPFTSPRTSTKDVSPPHLPRRHVRLASPALPPPERYSHGVAALSAPPGLYLAPTCQENKATGTANPPPPPFSPVTSCSFPSRSPPTPLNSRDAPSERQRLRGYFWRLCNRLSSAVPGAATRGSLARRFSR